MLTFAPVGGLAWFVPAIKGAAKKLHLICALDMFLGRLHTWRLVLPVLLLLPMLATAQDRVHLRLAYRGQFLPEGTAIVVLGQPVDTPPDSTIQPQFFSKISYPRTGFPIVLRDTIGTSGVSSKTIPKSSVAGMRYFIYALTPGGTLYWSYSALRDALKFDVVEKGVMSIAPVSGPVAESDIKQLFFSETPDREGASQTEAGTSAAETPPLATPPEPADTQPPDAQAPDGDPTDSGSEAVPPEGDLPDESGSPGLLVPLWLFVIAVLIPSSLAAYFIHRYLQARNQIMGMREEVTQLRTELASRFFHANPDTAERETTERSTPTPPPKVGNPIDPKRWNP